MYLQAAVDPKAWSSSGVVERCCLQLDGQPRCLPELERLPLADSKPSNKRWHMFGAILTEVAALRRAARCDGLSCYCCTCRSCGCGCHPMGRRARCSAPAWQYDAYCSSLEWRKLLPWLLLRPGSSLSITMPCNTLSDRCQAFRKFQK